MEFFLLDTHHFQDKADGSGQAQGTTTINHANLSLISKSITPDQFFTLSQINIRSIRNKTGQFQQHLIESSRDRCILLETWLKDSDEEKSLLSQTLLPDFNIISYPRTNGRGGGTAIIHKELVKILEHEGNYKAMTMECSSYKIKLAGETLFLYAIYHIPSTSVLQFCGKFTTLLEQDITSCMEECYWWVISTSTLTRKLHHIPSPSMTSWKA